MQYSAHQMFRWLLVTFTLGENLKLCIDTLVSAEK
jgi:hypothetical protein